MKERFLTWIAIFGFLFSCQEIEDKKTVTNCDWPVYSGSKSGNRYSAANQINRENVQQLEVAWSYNTGDKDPKNRSQNQCNPIVIDGVLYGLSPALKLFALDAATGQEKWVFDPISTYEKSKMLHVSRGVVYWENETGEEQRILYAAGPHLYAINAINGKSIESFGERGRIDLRKNLDRANTSELYFVGTSPGVIYNDLLIMGGRVSEGPEAAPGYVRAFDVLTGKLVWIYHTIPHPGEKGYDTWDDPEAYLKIGGANNWAGLSLDTARGIVYVPTGSASPDFYGASRKDQNLFANSLIALEAATGKYIWHYQVIHHDLWDRDLPANPNLVQIEYEGELVDAVAQITKHGYIFLFDRNTGKPLYEINEVPVPQKALPGESPWPTQPIPTFPENFARQKFDEEDVNDFTPEQNAYLLGKYRKVKNKEKFMPPSLEGNWIFPGFDGGGEWGGAAFNPNAQVLFINSTEIPWVHQMMKVPEVQGSFSMKEIGFQAYQRHCLSCHGQDMKGVGESYPSLENIQKDYSEYELRKLINMGRNMMPALSYIPDDEKQALITYLLDLPTDKVKIKQNSKPEVPFVGTGYIRFLDKEGYPGIKPPWGTLNAINLRTGKLIWKVPLGEHEELTARGIPRTGTENYGGPVATAGGLVFIAATKDEMIRAFDQDTGEELWQAKLPAAGYATPAVYCIGGRQFVVIACGGGKIGSKSGDAYVAFALPNSEIITKK